tara:strand:+ start:2457 stop:2621 length:165 start_codon:yes stop_codon:yes gene_type:complete
MPVVPAPEAVQMPVATVGECRLSATCHQYDVDLADGLCVWHWDRGIRRRKSVVH